MLQRLHVPGVYPRPRGGAPPTRGSPGPGVGRAGSPRSIPAHAGEPLQRVSEHRPREVYPRPRGGAPDTEKELRTQWGLSPPTRGSPAANTVGVIGSRSIPAHAGEPFILILVGIKRRVYPRPRGGAHDEPTLSVTDRGLSPPTRGSHTGGSGNGSWTRSIPAHAGEPRSRSRSRIDLRVYPRPRGGATVLCRLPPSLSGLSPPTRGSPEQPTTIASSPRSIPAHAGEPLVIP